MIEGIDLDGDGLDEDVIEDKLVPDGEEMEQPSDYDENALQHAPIRTREQFK